MSRNGQQALYARGLCAPLVFLALVSPSCPSRLHHTAFSVLLSPSASPCFSYRAVRFALHIPRRSVPPIRCVAILRQTLSMTGNDFCVVKFSLSRGCIATHRRHSCRLPAPRAASSRGPRTRLPWRLAEPPKIRVSGPGGPLRSPSWSRPPLSVALVSSRSRQLP